MPVGHPAGFQPAKTTSKLKQYEIYVLTDFDQPAMHTGFFSTYSLLFASE
jgi:hypothetical protein